MKYELIEYFPHKITKLNVEQLTWNSKNPIVNLFRYERYIFPKAYLMSLSEVDTYTAVKKLGIFNYEARTRMR